MNGFISKEEMNRRLRINGLVALIRQCDQGLEALETRKERLIKLLEKTREEKT